MPSVVIKIKKRSDQRTQLVIVVGKNTARKATERNLLKRRIRAIMQPYVHKRQGDGFIVVARPGSAALSFRELKQKIEKQLILNP